MAKRRRVARKQKKNDLLPVFLVLGFGLLLVVAFLNMSSQPSSQNSSSSISGEFSSALEKKLESLKKSKTCPVCHGKEVFEVGNESQPEEYPMPCHFCMFFNASSPEKNFYVSSAFLAEDYNALGLQFLDKYQDGGLFVYGKIQEVGIGSLNNKVWVKLD